jgi:hypothetical protein
MVHAMMDRGHIYMPFKGRRRITLTGKAELSNFTADELLQELRERGFIVSGERGRTMKRKAA